MDIFSQLINNKSNSLNFLDLPALKTVGSYDLSSKVTSVILPAEHNMLCMYSLKNETTSAASFVINFSNDGGSTFLTGIANHRRAVANASYSSGFGTNSDSMTFGTTYNSGNMGGFFFITKNKINSTSQLFSIFFPDDTVNVTFTIVGGRVSTTFNSFKLSTTAQFSGNIQLYQFS